jgi:hypothetical protein
MIPPSASRQSPADRSGPCRTNVVATQLHHARGRDLCDEQSPHHNGYPDRESKIAVDDAITGTKRPQSLNSAARTNDGREIPETGARASRTAEQGVLLRAGIPTIVTARPRWESKHSPSGPAAIPIFVNREISGRSFYAPQPGA